MAATIAPLTIADTTTIITILALPRDVAPPAVPKTPADGHLQTGPTHDNSSPNTRDPGFFTNDRADAGILELRRRRQHQ